jgi:type II secretory pathway component GspD/PulD (secretin)
MERTVSLNFLGADINDVLKALSVQSGENIVAGKDVTGNVTVSLADVGLEEALDYVARLSGYSYAQEKDTYLVGTRDSLRNLMSEDTGTPKVEVVALNYADGDSVISLLKSQYPGVQTSKSSAAAKTATQGAVSGSTGDVIVLSGMDSTVSQAKQLIAQVEDSLRSRAAKETAKVYKVKYVSPFELRRTIETLVPEVRATVAPSDGFKLFAPEAVKVGSGSGAGGATVEHAEVKIDTEELGWIQALVFYGTETAVDRAADLAEQLDVKSPQIKIEAKIVSLTKSGEKKLGVNWNWSDFGWFEGFTDFEKTYNMTPDGENKQNVWKSHKNLIRQPWSVIGQLDALIEQGDGQLLANPSMVCVEGKPGVFFVGDEVRYIILIQNTTTGQNVQTETANVGVQLRVVGDVSSDGFITLNLHPEVSVIQLNVNEETGITLPIITRRFTDHVVRVRDGQTIAIGGLIRDEELDIMSKIPILGDIPILGKLFRHRHKTTDHSEVAMFITASVIQD